MSALQPMRILLTLVLIVRVFSANAQDSKTRWVDSVFRQLTEADKVAQLLLVPASTDWEDNRLNNALRDIISFKTAGVVFSRGSALEQLSLTRQLQASATTPLFVAMDAPRGPGPLLDSTLTWPTTLAVGAISDDSLVWAHGMAIARQLKALGVNMQLGLNANLAGDTDRPPAETFGDNRLRVARTASLVMQGLRAGGVISCAQAFPVQGITATEINDGIPQVKTLIDTAQVYPFLKLFQRGLPAVMPGVKDFPVFFEKKVSARKNRFPGSMLATFNTGNALREQFGYEGLVIVDIRKFEASSQRIRSGDAEVLAFQMGNHLMITDNNPAAVIRRIRRMLRRQKEFRPQLDASVRRVLEAKYDAGLIERVIPQPTPDLLAQLNTAYERILLGDLLENTITISHNDGNSLPVRALENKRFASIVVGKDDTRNLFHHYISKYAASRSADVNTIDDLSKLRSLRDQSDVVIVALMPQAKTEIGMAVLDSLRKENPENPRELIICDFGSDVLEQAAPGNAVIHAWSADPETIRITASAVFGGAPVTGTMPRNMGILKEGVSIMTPSLRRLQFSFPEDVGMTSDVLAKIDGIVLDAIANKATPGCHVLVARKGKVIFEKSYGHLTYEKQIPVADSTVYDLASVTKVSATLQAVMFLYDRQMIDLYKKASFYLPELKQSNKKDFTLKDILTHQSGLWPFLLFWPQTMKDSVTTQMYYDRKPSLKYPFVVSDNLYASRSMKDSLWSWIVGAKIREKPARTPFDFRYSDMGFYILQHLAEKMLNQPMEDFLAQNLYEPLGASGIGYLPLTRFRPSRIAPTERDTLWRRALLIGTVHDQGAAMHGGVAGHAGLFGTANDLAKLGQMLLQEGYYGGYQYYRPETVRLFTAKQYSMSRRGLGWDKPTQSDWNSPTSIHASPRTFGHTGFTGTCIWVDPEFDLVYVFLSNRVHPDMTNNKLLSSNIRSRIQDALYESIFDFCKKGGGSPQLLASPDFGQASNK